MPFYSTYKFSSSILVKRIKLKYNRFTLTPHDMCWFLDFPCKIFYTSILILCLIMVAVWCSLEITDLDICLLTLHLSNFCDKSWVSIIHCGAVSQFPWCWSMQAVSFVVLYPDSSQSFLHLDTGLCVAAQLFWLEQHHISTQMTELAVLSCNHTSFSTKVAKRVGNPSPSEASYQTILAFRKFYFWKQEKFKQPQKIMLWYFHGKNSF